MFDEEKQENDNMNLNGEGAQVMDTMFHKVHAANVPNVVKCWLQSQVVSGVNLSQAFTISFVA